MLNYEKDIAGAFSCLPEKEKEIIMEIVANFHLRNRARQTDGSMGEIIITTKQMNDCLAWMMRPK